MMVGGGGGEPHDQSAQKKHICRQCNKSFPSVKALGGHMRMHPRVHGLLREEQPETERLTSSVNNEISFEVQQVAMFLIRMSRDVGSSASASTAVDDSTSTNSATMAEESHDGSNQDNFACSGYVEEGSNSRARARKRRGEGGFDGQHVSEKVKNSKKGRFQCSTCKKVFSSHQALGGHRAASKRSLVTCNVPEDVAETELAVTPANNADDHQCKGKEVVVEEEEEEEMGGQSTSTGHDQPEGKKKKKKKKKEQVGGQIVSTGHDEPERKPPMKYQCPTCPKVFASGRALGGHRRSHVVHNASKAKPKPVKETNGALLDLNAPAPAEEDSNITVRPTASPAGKNTRPKATSCSPTNG